MITKALLRIERGRARPVLRLFYDLAARLLALAVAPRGTAYVARTVAAGDAVYGLSDIDLVVVTGDPERARRRRDRLPRLARKLASEIAVYSPAELAAARSATTLTTAQPLYLVERWVHDELGLRERPGLGVPGAEWRRLRGRERRGPAEAGELRAAAWLELQFWWQQTLRLARDPGGRHATYFCFKLVAEPVRILLALEHGELERDRQRALRRALVLMPEEEPALRRALALRDRLAGPPPWDEALADFVRLSERIARLVCAGPPGTAVRLTGTEPVLLDWRGLVLPAPRDDRFRVGDGDPRSRADIEALAGSRTYTVLRHGELAVLGAHGPWTRALLRGVHCRASAPVLFAQLEGDGVAEFPSLPGFRARDVAHRAAAESAVVAPSLHARSWLDGRDDGLDPGDRERGRRAATARAELFERSLEAGDPVIATDAVALAEARA